MCWFLTVNAFVSADPHPFFAKSRSDGLFFHSQIVQNKRLANYIESVHILRTTHYTCAIKILNTEILLHPALAFICPLRVTCSYPCCPHRPPPPPYPTSPGMVPKYLIQEQPDSAELYRGRAGLWDWLVQHTAVAGWLCCSNTFLSKKTPCVSFPSIAPPTPHLSALSALSYCSPQNASFRCLLFELISELF